MPLYIVTSKGGLITAKGKPNLAKGDTVEMTAEQAASLPLGTVELIKPNEPKPAPTKEKSK